MCEGEYKGDMDKIKVRGAGNGRTDVWRPTMELRWCFVDFSYDYARDVLQQRWVSDSGKEEWRDVVRASEREKRY